MTILTSDRDFVSARNINMYMSLLNTLNLYQNIAERLSLKVSRNLRDYLSSFISYPH